MGLEIWDLYNSFMFSTLRVSCSNRRGFNCARHALDNLDSASRCLVSWDRDNKSTMWSTSSGGNDSIGAVAVGDEGN